MPVPILEGAKDSPTHMMHVLASRRQTQMEPNANSIKHKFENIWSEEAVV